jgi:hypothetical protein
VSRSKELALMKDRGLHRSREALVGWGVQRIYIYKGLERSIEVLIG